MRISDWSSDVCSSDLEALTPPAVSSLEASGAGHGEANTAVTKFQNLLHSASVNLVKRFAILPDQAGAYIAWLSDIIADVDTAIRSEEHTSELQSLMRISYAVFCLKKKKLMFNNNYMSTLKIDYHSGMYM